MYALFVHIFHRDKKGRRTWNLDAVDYEIYVNIATALFRGLMGHG